VLLINHALVHHLIRSSYLFHVIPNVRLHRRVIFHHHHHVTHNPWRRSFSLSVVNVTFLIAFVCNRIFETLDKCLSSLINSHYNFEIERHLNITIHGGNFTHIHGHGFSVSGVGLSISCGFVLHFHDRRPCHECGTRRHRRSRIRGRK
jgi:hypothetical protein